MAHQIISDAVRGCYAQVEAQLAEAIALLADTQGVVVTTGLGKSGFVTQRLAATLRSVGCVAAFLHASDALHGDLGVLRAGDALVAASYSGTTTEVVTVCRVARERRIPIVALTGDGASPLAQLADVVLGVSVAREADPWNLVPSASLAATATVGDLLAIGVMLRRGHDSATFASNHPGGALGRRLHPTGKGGP